MRRRENTKIDVHLALGESEFFRPMVHNLRGLTRRQLPQLRTQPVAVDRALTDDDLAAVQMDKRVLLQDSGVLEFVDAPTSMDQIGGLGALKRWLREREGSFDDRARDFGLSPPRGVLLLGVQGAGKSLAAKCVAGAWNLPLFRLDFGTLYQKYHGETERNMREALSIAGAMAPCVLWMDEIEKGIAGDSGGDADGGVSRRVLGTLLTWMAERKVRVFMVATANDISQLPPELLRKGRFDEIFFVDLPKAPAREQILRIHLKQRKLDPATFDLAALAASSDGFSGAELEQAVVSALYEAHATKAPLKTEHVAREMGRTKSISVVMAEKIASLRQWAAERAVAAD